MGFSPMGGASSYGQSKRDFDNSIGRDRHRDRNDRDRRNRESSYSTREREARERQEQIERAKKAREKAERRARYEAKRKEEEAEAAKNSSSGFSPMGGLSSYGLNASSISPIGGRGVLAGMRSASDPEEREIYERSQNPTQYGSIHFRAPTSNEAKGNIYTNENAYAGEAINENTSEENIARLTGDAIGEKGFKAARTLMASPFGPVGSAVSEVVGWASDLLDDSTDWEKAIKDQIKADMESGNLIKNIGSTAQTAAAVGAMKGNSFAQDAASVLLNPAAFGVIGVADDIIGYEKWKDRNREYLDSHGLLDRPSSPQETGGGRGDRPSGILANMMPFPNQPVAEPTTEPELPDFDWVDGDDFNSNYGMGFKR